MHIFLTGTIQVGKSTIITQTLRQLNHRYGGFKTYFGPDRRCDDRLLYMNGADEPNSFSKNYGIAIFKRNCFPQADTAKFNTYGVELIRRAKTNEAMIIMDECGNLECQALKFQHEILKTLDEELPVLGVIKQDSSGWTDMIRNHRKVKLITVTRENRHTIPAMLVNYYLKSHHFKKP